MKERKKKDDFSDALDLEEHERTREYCIILLSCGIKVENFEEMLNIVNNLILEKNNNNDFIKNCNLLLGVGKEDEYKYKNIKIFDLKGLYGGIDVVLSGRNVGKMWVMDGDDENEFEKKSIRDQIDIIVKRLDMNSYLFRMAAKYEKIEIAVGYINKFGEFIREIKI